MDFFWLTHKIQIQKPPHYSLQWNKHMLDIEYKFKFVQLPILSLFSDVEYYNYLLYIVFHKYVITQTDLVEFGRTCLWNLS